ncbi:3-oxoacyl-ACP synthase [Jejuia spongiicola]|uniref:3-oxoacyl-ACP synthase n=1 Tax=Jejuia spongiicola TaxID=2942207 RepID=A0ABT0Q988_9FLAO|nr:MULTISPECIES: 3-oxoacyl-ACP synthase [Flavobacteriaceae]MCL6293516.1 3-oxoacyl-ACP synthase [Jejuia spongiicola]PIA78917.1 3-oxoacyl-ACP synthase [Gaetbulibacter sp. 4G1]
MAIKKELFNLCLEFTDSRLQTIQKTIAEIQESLTSETKSSAGDKHETGRAMLQLEREKAGNQLAEIIKIKETLSRIDIDKSIKTVGLGSVIYTTVANYYLAISAGELRTTNDKFYAISPSTPIGQLLIGKTIDDEIVFRNQKFKIKKLL